MAWPAGPKSYASSWSVTLPTSAWQREMTQRSGSGSDCISAALMGSVTASDWRSASLSSPRPITMKRAVFHSLLAKLRLAVTFSIASGTSWPGVQPVTRERRRASVPYSSIVLMGSTTLPLVFDIFWPLPSRTRPCM